LYNSIFFFTVKEKIKSSGATSSRRRIGLVDLEAKTIRVGEDVVLWCERCLCLGRGTGSMSTTPGSPGQVFFVVVPVVRHDGWLQLSTVARTSPPEIVPHPPFTAERVPDLVDVGILVEKGHDCFPRSEDSIQQLFPKRITGVFSGEFIVRDPFGVKIQQETGGGVLGEGPYAEHPKIFVIVLLVHGDMGTGKKMRGYRAADMCLESGVFSATLDP